jgi:hypothetical protein
VNVTNYQDVSLACTLLLKQLSYFISCLCVLLNIFLLSSSLFNFPFCFPFLQSFFSRSSKHL